jgi:hypothetical protein
MRASSAAISLYSSQLLSVCRTSTRASRASYCPRYQSRSWLSSARLNFSPAWPYSSCGQQPKGERKNQNTKCSDEKEVGNEQQSNKDLTSKIWNDLPPWSRSASVRAALREVS